jgi:phytanoyl-CoA hydroxylase
VNPLLLPGVEALPLDELLGQYEAHGYARLGRVLSDEGLALLRERAEDLMLGRVSYPGMFFQMDAVTGRYEDAPLGLGWQGPSLGYRKLEKLELDDRFLGFLRNPLFERIARARIAGPVVLYRALLFNKGPQGGSDIPWHQDGGRLWGLSAEPDLQLWTALDDAPVGGGCLEVLPGTHAAGLATPLGGLVPPEKLEQAAAEARAVPLPVKAGEGLLLHNHLWHRSGRTPPGTRRLAFSACLMSGAIRCLRKRKAPRTFFEVFP